MKAKQYGLNFVIIRQPNRVPIPDITSDVNDSGYLINYEFASFISPGGVAYTQEIRDEVASLDLENYTGEGYTMYSYNEVDTIEAFSSPPRISVWSGDSYLDIPKQDFIEILQEWIDFLNGLNYDHALIGK